MFQQPFCCSDGFVTCSRKRSSCLGRPWQTEAVVEAAAAPGVPATTQATILDFVDDAKDTVTVVALLEGSKSRERGVGAAAAGLDSVNDGAGGLCCAATDGSSCFLILVVVVAGKKRNAPLVFSKKTDGRTEYIPRGLFSRQRSRLQSERYEDSSFQKQTKHRHPQRGPPHGRRHQTNKSPKHKRNCLSSRQRCRCCCRHRHCRRRHHCHREKRPSCLSFASFAATRTANFLLCSRIAPARLIIVVRQILLSNKELSWERMSTCMTSVFTDTTHRL